MGNDGPSSGDAVDLVIDRVDGDLCGRATHGGVDVIVPGTGPGDRVRVRIDHVSPHRPVAWASLVDVAGRGDDVLALPACPHAAPLAGACGGCPGMHLRYGAQLAARSAALAETLAPLGVGEVPLSPSPRTEEYRNRTNHVVARLADGSVRLGSRVPRGHDVAAMDGCRIVRRPIADVAAGIADLLAERGWAVWPEPAGVRTVSVRANTAGDALVELIVGARADGDEALCDAVLALPGVVGVAVSANDTTGNALRVEPATPVAGRPTITERYGAVSVEVSADAFLQLNTDVASAMYVRAAGHCAGARRITDLYCGVGGLGLCCAAATGARLSGVEVHEGAVRLAAAAAARMRIPAAFSAASLGDGVPSGLLDADVVVVNPPRRGLDDAVRAALAAAPPARLVYMSCSPTSFVRDALALAEAGLRPVTVEAWDMLPHTGHVELLASFEASGGQRPASENR